jgi:2-methylcitrate dehydratase PrpD
MSISLEIARRSIALDAPAFPEDALEWARVAIIDMIGCALAGAPDEATEIALAATVPPGSTGDATVIGRGERLRLLDAAFINGVSGHALDFDDTSKSMAGHPTVVIIPALLALAEQRAASGRAVLDAYIVGVETATRIARGVNFHHYEKGWHPTATLGIFGTAAACCRLLDLDEAQTATALAICVSNAAGVKSNFGTQTKPVHAGASARSGLFAALLAQGGFKAGTRAFEHPQGFLSVFNGEGHFDASRMLENWGEPLDLLAPGISIKKYPCVYSIHGAIDAAIGLREKHGFAGSDIAGVTVSMHRRRLLPHVQREATSTLDAKFSLSYAVARALVDGAVLMSHFEGEAFRDERVRAVMGLVTSKPHDDDDNDYGAEVELRLKDGTRLAASVPAPLGRGPEVPLPREMPRAKFADCASRSLDAAAAQALFDALTALEKADDIRDVTAMMRPGPGHLATTSLHAAQKNEVSP